MAIMEKFAERQDTNQFSIIDKRVFCIILIIIGNITQVFLISAIVLRKKSLQCKINVSNYHIVLTGTKFIHACTT